MTVSLTEPQSISIESGNGFRRQQRPMMKIEITATRAHTKVLEQSITAMEIRQTSEANCRADNATQEATSANGHETYEWQVCLLIEGPLTIGACDRSGRGANLD